MEIPEAEPDNFDIVYATVADAYGGQSSEDGVWKWMELSQDEDQAEDRAEDQAEAGCSAIKDYPIGIEEEADEAEPDDEKDDEDEEELPKDVSGLDKREEVLANEWFGENAKPCCRLKCTELVPQSLILATRQSFQEFEKNEQDLMILHFLESHRRTPELKEEYGQRTARGKTRTTSSYDESSPKLITYVYRDFVICKNLFLYLYDIGTKRYQHLQQHHGKFGLCERRHGKAGKKSTNQTAITLDQRQDVITFIKTFAEKHAIPLPGRMANCKNYRVVKLPASMTKARVYRHYIAAVKESNQEVQTANENAPSTSHAEESAPSEQTLRREISYRSFLEIWEAHVPYITTTKPAQDLCDTCRVNTLGILKKMNATEEEKKEALKIAEEHLLHAQQQRQYYNDARKMAQESKTISVDGVDRSFNVLCFDFAEQVHFHE